MEQETVALAPITKRSKCMAVKKINNKRSFSFAVDSIKSNPLTQATRVTFLVFRLLLVFNKIYIYFLTQTKLVNFIIVP